MFATLASRDWTAEAIDDWLPQTDFVVVVGDNKSKP
jgi:hypothetical protein